MAKKSTVPSKQETNPRRSSRVQLASDKMATSSASKKTSSSSSSLKTRLKKTSSLSTKVIAKKTPKKVIIKSRKQPLRTDGSRPVVSTKSSTKKNLQPYRTNALRILKSITDLSCSEGAKQELTSVLEQLIGCLARNCLQSIRDRKLVTVKRRISVLCLKELIGVTNENDMIALESNLFRDAQKNGEDAVARFTRSQTQAKKAKLLAAPTTITNEDQDDVDMSSEKEDEEDHSPSPPPKKSTQKTLVSKKKKSM